MKLSIAAALLIASAEGFFLCFENTSNFRYFSFFDWSILFNFNRKYRNSCGLYCEAVGGVEIQDIGDASDDEIQGHDSLIVGAPTWHTGADEQRSGTAWDDWLYDTLPNLDLDGKKVAVFGVGDQQSYCDNYCDAAGELYDLFSAKGAKMYGMTSTDGYDHTESKAEMDGKFCGLMCDEDNQYDESEGRAKAWVAQLKDEGFF